MGYKGQRREGYRINVTRSDGTALPLIPSLRVFNHSPDGFEWGYAGSGPAQLSLAILLDITKDEGLALAWHQDFKFDIISALNRDEWELSDGQIEDWLRTKVSDRERV